MSELLLEIATDEMPGGMLKQVAFDLARLVSGAFSCEEMRVLYTPRRLALIAHDFLAEPSPAF